MTVSMRGIEAMTATAMVAMAGLGAVGCGSSESDDARLAGGDAAQLTPGEPVLGAPVAAFQAEPSRPSTDPEPPDAGTPEPGEAGTRGCVPSAEADLPDDDFMDTNCDGIDGDVANAVFVATTGDDQAAGTPAAPVATLGRAIALGATTARSVYVCSGEYAENVHLDGAAVNLYGGYACENGWKRRPDRPVVKPPSGLPLVVERVTSALTIDRIAFRAPDAPAEVPGGSSIAAAVFASPKVVLSHLELSAGDATAGVSGEALPDPRWEVPAPGLDGKDVEGAIDCYMDDGAVLARGSLTCLLITTAAVGKGHSCPDGSLMVGGQGGDGANPVWGASPTSGKKGTPFLSVTYDDGPAGSPGLRGRAASLGVGTLSKGRYLADNSGEDGQPGSAGTAGRGGDGQPYYSGTADPLTLFFPGASGGQGGSPGCPGRGGRAGTAGGGSIALLSDHSGIRVVLTDIHTGKGGGGGVPSAGAPGQAGSPGGLGGHNSHPNHTRAPSGGRGGDGGGGGEGGPGGGGPSIGVLSIGGTPSVEDATFYLGVPGRGGRGQESTGADGIGPEQIYSLDPPAAPAGTEGGAP